jgi:hypothetical protein
MKKNDIPDNLDEYEMVDVEVSFYCPKCKVDVPKDDAFVVVGGCSINQKAKKIYNIPDRAFHFNFINGVDCRADLEIRENHSGKG